MGDLRWKAPVDVTPDDGVYEAYYFGKVPCQVGSVGEVLETMRGRRLELREVKNLKFVEVLKPGSVGEVVITFDKMEEDGSRLAAKGTVASESRTYTKFSLVFEML